MYEVFEKLLEKNNLRPYDVAKALNFSPSTLSSWKRGEYSPKREKLQAIADYFGVSLHYLMTGKPDLPQDSPEYFYNEDARDLAEFLHKNPDYKVLFDATRKVKREDIEFVKRIIDKM